MIKMNFDTFKEKRNEYVNWINANGFNDGDCDTNGEFKVLQTFSDSFDLFVDVGANHGIFIDKLNEEANAMDKFILAFEPNPNLKTVLDGKIVRGDVIQSALSDKKGRSAFNIYEDDTTSSLFSRSDMMPHFVNRVNNIEVSVDTLDSYLPLIEIKSAKSVFLKIDAEGAELSVLKGGSKMLSKLPNIFLMFEYSTAWKIANNSLKEAFHLLDSIGFKIFRVTPLGLEALRFYTPDMDGSDYCNYLAVKGVSVEDVLENRTIRSATHNQNNFYLFP